MNSFKESTRLAFLKDKFIRLWPNLSYQLVDLDSEYCTDNKKTLVVGSGRNPKIQGKNIINTDIRPFRSVLAVTDTQWLSFADDSFDVIICHQVLEHVPNADQAVREIHRVLKPGGRVIVTVPFYFPFHASPYDFRRWTIHGLKATFHQFSDLDSGVYIGPISAVLTGIQEFVGLLVPNFYLSYLVKGAMGWILYPLKFLDKAISKLPHASAMAASVYFVGEKRSHK